MGKLHSDDTGEMDDSWAQGLYLWLFPGEKALSVSSALDCIDVLTVRYRLVEVEEIGAGMLIFGYVSKTSGTEYKDLEGRFELFDMDGNFLIEGTNNLVVSGENFHVLKA